MIYLEYGEYGETVSTIIIVHETRYSDDREYLTYFELL